MTALTEKDVRRIAKLSCIAVTDDEVTHYHEELSGLLDWIAQLQEVNTDGVPEMSSVSQVSLPRRPDAVTDGNCVEKVIANAPEKAFNCFVVPKVVE